MSNYTKSTNFTAKDSLPTGDTNKVVRGSEFDTEFNALSTAVATKADLAGPTFTGTATFANVTATGTVNFNGATISNLGTITTANLDGGTVDGAVIGGASAAAGSFTTLSASSTFSLGGVAVTSTAAELNILDGVTSTAAELNILDGVTSTAAELNILDGVTSTAAELNILDGVTSTAAELNILDGVTSTAAELNILDGVTATASELNILSGKAFVDEDDLSSNSATGIPSQQSVKAYVDSQTGLGGATLAGLADTTVTSPADAALLFYDTGTSKWIDNVVSGDVTIADTGVASIGSGVIVNADINASAAIDISKLNGITSTAAELNYTDGVTSNIQTQLDSKVGANYTGDVNITGELLVDSYNETFKKVTSSSNATTANCEDANVFEHVLTENTTFTFSNPPASGAPVVSYYQIASASHTRELSVSSQDPSPTDLAFNSDGTKMFVVGYHEDRVNEYALTTGFDLSTSSFTRYFSVASQDTQPEGLAFNNDGTKMFVLGNAGTDVNEYALTTGFNISTASYTQNFSVSSQEAAPEGITFNNDGTKMFIVGRTDDEVNEYALTTGFDISTASYTRNFSVASQDLTPTGLDFNSDGTKMFVIGRTNDSVYEYTLTTGFNISTASYTRSLSISSKDTSPSGIRFSSDGAKMFILGMSSVKVHEYATSSSSLNDSTAYAMSLKVVQDAGASGYTVTWPASVDWPAATAPTLTATANAVDQFVFYTYTGGTTWYGFTAGQALG